VLGTLIAMAVGGVIGNRANDAFGWFLGVLPGINQILFPWIVILVVVLACGGVVCWLVTVIVRTHHEISDLEHEISDLEQRNSVLNHAFTTQHNLVLLDDSLLRLLASWIPSKDHENEMKSILAELLSDASAAFNGHVHRAFLLRPAGEHLKIWTHYGMPEDTVKDLSFYVGSDWRKQRGTAGQAFVNQELRVGHLTQAGNVWVCEDRYFIPCGKRPAYRAFVAIPIIGVSPTATNANTAVCLGVVCFDSLQPDIFDSEGNRDVLRVFARRIAAALLLFEQLK
jgi:hypothetical protein